MVRIFRGEDIRRLGSGSSGATNVTRVLGLKYGIPVLLFDTAKGFLPTFFLTPWLINSGQIAWSEVPVKIVLGIFCIAGHIWTIFGKFKGGKGVGTGAGVVLSIYPLATVICLAIWGIIMGITRFVSVASMAAALCFPVVVFSIGHHDLALRIFSLLFPLLILFTHRRNIQRLFKGKENRIG